MTKITLKMALVLGTLSVLIVSVSGCTNSTNTTSGGGQNQAMAYATALSNFYNTTLGPNGTVISSQVTANGTDGARLSITSTNTTSQVFYLNGTTATLSVSIQHFSSTDEATAFYNNQSFGYAPAMNFINASTSIDNPHGAYYNLTGHDSTTNSFAVKVMSLAEVSIVMQQNEFVTFGDVSVISK